MSESVVIRLPGIDIASEVEFEAFQRGQKKESRILEAEDAKMGYEAVPEEGNYCLAIRNKTTGKMRLVEAPVMSVSSYVKERRMAEDADRIRQLGIQNMAQRTALGEAFGTKKAKAAIDSRVKNKVDTDMLEDIEVAIVDSVKMATKDLPSQEQRQKAMESKRPIPPYDLEATTPDLAFPLEGIVSNQELQLLKVDELVDAENAEARQALLPCSKSDFLNQRMEQIINEKSNVKPRLRILAYASFLLAVYQARRANSKEQLMEKLGNPPEQLIDTVLHKFTISRPGMFGKSKDRSFVFDPSNQDKLLCYFLCLVLHLEDFFVDVTPLAHELALKQTKLIDLFRALGCVVRSPSAAETKERELTAAVASTYRLAKLNAPLVLPEIAKRKRAN